MGRLKAIRFATSMVAAVHFTWAFDFSTAPLQTPLEFSNAKFDEEFDWDAIKPSRSLVYHDCYHSSRCARLEVPLNWLNESDSRTAAIAIRTLPAQVADESPLFGGSILANPGGPGGSGVKFIGDSGGMLQRYLDQPGRRYYEIVSFDPRGVGRTTPATDCFNYDPLARDAWLLQMRGNGPLSFGTKSISYGLALMQAMSQQCNQTEQHWGDVGEYVNTPTVARDMVAIIDKIDELRKREAAQKQGHYLEAFHHEDLHDENLDKRARAKADGPVPRLQYIGFSYGTVLGNYFASLFPGRVGRIILDGVCDTDDYANGPGWNTNLVDTDKILGEFFKGCFVAGPAICALANNFSSPMEAEQRFWEVVDSLDKEPRAVVGTKGETSVISGQDLTRMLGSQFYEPIATFKPLASILQQVLTGSLETIADFVSMDDSLPSLENACPLANGSIARPTKREATFSVLCSDGDTLVGKDTQWWFRYIENQVSISRIFGSEWSLHRFACAFWPFLPNWSFKGPFTTPRSDPALRKGVPASPLLFLSNVLDPVTPLRAARKMAALHPGAQVVAQDSIGHCALLSAFSSCTRAIVAEYLETGRVPSGESHCNATCGPWDESCLVSAANADDASSLFLGNSDRSIRNRKFPLGVQ